VWKLGRVDSYSQIHNHCMGMLINSGQGHVGCNRLFLKRLEELPLSFPLTTTTYSLLSLNFPLSLYPPTHLTQHTLHIYNVRTRKRYALSPPCSTPLFAPLSPSFPLFAPLCVQLLISPLLFVASGGKGLGKGGAKRHRKILRDNMFVRLPLRLIPRRLQLTRFPSFLVSLSPSTARVSPSPPSDVSHDEEVSSVSRA
jgi:hypothetical protein